MNNCVFKSPFKNDAPQLFCAMQTKLDIDRESERETERKTERVRERQRERQRETEADR